jgi:hypothetical protein
VLDYLFFSRRLPGHLRLILLATTAPSGVLAVSLLNIHPWLMTPWAPEALCGKITCCGPET